MLKNFVLETATNPGQGANVLLAGAPTGRRGFVASFGSGAPCFYVLDDGTLQEWGIGTVVAGVPNALQRTTVLGNSEGTASRLNFAGTTNVYCDVPSERMPWFDAANTLAMAARRISNLGAATLQTDAAQLRQVAWVDISRQIVPGAVGAVVFALPAGFDRYRIEWADLAGAAAGFFWARLSFDGGATFVSSASYNNVTEAAAGASGVVASTTTGEVRLTGSASAASPAFGGVEFQCFGLHNWLSDAQFTDAVPQHARFRGAGRLEANGGQQPTHAIVANSGGNVTAGRFKLLGSAP